MISFKWLLLLPVAVLVGCRGSSSSVETASDSPTDAAKSVIDPLENLPYMADNDHGHLLDLYLPKDKKHEPLLIFIHGGAWIGGDKSTFVALGHRFAGAGLAVACLNYRLSGSPAKLISPSHVQDTSQAYAWLVKNAAKYGYDPKKIFVSGHSAGGHNAGMMATGTFLQDAHVPKENLPAGYIGMEGIYDVVAFNKRFPRYKDWFLEKAFGDEKGWAKGSPALRPSVLKAPWLVIQSTQDRLVDVAQATEFGDHLSSSGVKVEMYLKPLGGHDAVVGSLVDPNSKTASEIIKFIGS